MYDNVRSNSFDPGNCLHLACSEIRAANLAGYCDKEFSYVNSMVNSSWNKKRNHDCVKAKSNEHLMLYYQHCQKDSIKYINEAWGKCYADKSPIKDFSKEESFI
jgi:hypothetical protein